MKLCMHGSVAHLQGDLTHDGMTSQGIESLSVSMQQLESDGVKKFHIDCRRILTADFYGLQLLYVWVQCARIRGMETELVNLPDALHTALQRSGFLRCFQAVSLFNNSGLTLLPVQ